MDEAMRNLRASLNRAQRKSLNSKYTNTNHKKFNEHTAILAGDGLLNYAYLVISEDLKNKALAYATKKGQRSGRVAYDFFRANKIGLI